MSELEELVAHIETCISIYDTFVDNVSEIDHEVFKKANTDCFLGKTYKEGMNSKEAIQQLKGYVKATKDFREGKTK